ncbi:MAG: hypothetical protein ACFB4I_07550 [Cyanophyceae cyanobacterium]
MFTHLAKTFLLTTIAATAAAPLLSTGALAQLFPEQRRTPVTTPERVVIPAGTKIPVRYDEAEKILVTKEETVPLTLRVAANVRTRSGTVLIPYDSQVVGQIEPAGDGSRFVAEEIIIDTNRPQPLDAASEIVTRTEVVEGGASAGDILEGAAVGAAAASVLAVVIGDEINVEEVLGGAGIGALAGWILGGNEAELVSIDPETDLALYLRSPLDLR